MASDDSGDILKVIRRINEGHPLRQLADLVLRDPRAFIANPQPVLRAFSHKHSTRRRVVASWLIVHANWSDSQRHSLSEMLSGSVERAIAPTKLGYTTKMQVSAVIAGCSIVYSLCLGANPLLLLPAGIGVFWLLSLLPVGADRNTIEQLCPPVIGALGNLGQPASLPTIADAYMHDPLRIVAAAAVAKVTARLRPEDYGTLPSRTVPALCRILPKADSQTALVILRALTIIGDERAIRAVGSLAGTTQSREIREAAANVLAILQQRAAESQASSVLLRSSSASADEKRALLRAATLGACADPPELMVRASQGPGDGMQKRS
jgi:hypothetical protein